MKEKHLINKQLSTNGTTEPYKTSQFQYWFYNASLWCKKWEETQFSWHVRYVHSTGAWYSRLGLTYDLNVFTFSFFYSLFTVLAHRYAMVRSFDVVSALRWPPATGRVVHELLLSGAAPLHWYKVTHSQSFYDTVLQSLTTETQIWVFFVLLKGRIFDLMCFHDVNSKNI